MEYTVLTKKEGCFWIVECLDLPGCVSQGKNKKEAMANIKEAIELYLEIAEEDNISLPRVKLEKVTV